MGSIRMELILGGKDTRNISMRTTYTGQIHVPTLHPGRPD